MLLQANNLSCVREDRTLFEHLSFAVRSGDLMQIEGPNGVGKTSLLRLLTGLSQPFAGEVCWNGENIRHCRDEYHASLLYLGHQPGVKATLTPLENLSFYQKLHGTAEASVDLWQVLAQVGLAGIAHGRAAPSSQPFSTNTWRTSCQTASRLCAASMRANRSGWFCRRSA